MGAMKDFLMRWLVLTVAAAVMVVLLPGMTAVGAASDFGNRSVRAVHGADQRLDQADDAADRAAVSILTFGLLYLVINWLFMRLSSWLAISLFGVGVLVHGFWWAVLGSLIMSIVSGIVGSIVRD